MSEPGKIENAVRQDLRQVETGSADAAQKVQADRTAHPEAVDAVEQEMSEAPPGRGLSR